MRAKKTKPRHRRDLYACTTEHEPEERCTVPPVMCPACGHALSLHEPVMGSFVRGHECAGTIYEGGKVCPCAEYQ